MATKGLGTYGIKGSEMYLGASPEWDLNSTIKSSNVFFQIYLDADEEKLKWGYCDVLSFSGFGEKSCLLQFGQPVSYANSVGSGRRREICTYPIMGK